LNNQETVLVVGGAGYIGSVNVAQLIDQGKNVIVVDNFENGHREAVHPNAIVEECDLRNKEAIEQVFQNHSIDSVMHFAAYAYVGVSMSQADEYFTNNFIGGHHLLNAMRKHEVDRIVFSSTCATYGDVQKVPIDETFPKEPINPYGRTKLAFEMLLKSYEDSYGIRHAILRYFNASGATETLGEDHRPETHLIPLVLQVALGQRESITIFGTDYDTPDGSCIRDYIHISDLADAHLRALDYIRKESVICNLGTEVGNSVKEVIETSRKVTGHAIPAVEKDRRPGDPPRLTASAAKAKSLLGWNPQFTDIEKTISSAWNWHKQHPNGYAS
jgi:UDP-glucose 4-epimerase